MPTIKCILHGSLEDTLKDGSAGGHTQLDFTEPPSVGQILKHLGISRDRVQFALVDGQYVDFEHWDAPHKGHLFQFWPRISGG